MIKGGDRNQEHKEGGGGGCGCRGISEKQNVGGEGKRTRYPAKPLRTSSPW